MHSDEARPRRRRRRRRAARAAPGSSRPRRTARAGPGTPRPRPAGRHRARAPAARRRARPAAVALEQHRLDLVAARAQRLGHRGGRVERDVVFGGAPPARTTTLKASARAWARVGVEVLRLEAPDRDGHAGALVALLARRRVLLEHHVVAFGAVDLLLAPADAEAGRLDQVRRVVGLLAEHVGHLDLLRLLGDRERHGGAPRDLAAPDRAHLEDGARLLVRVLALGEGDLQPTRLEQPLGLVTVLADDVDHLDLARPARDHERDRAAALEPRALGRRRLDHAVRGHVLAVLAAHVDAEARRLQPPLGLGARRAAHERDSGVTRAARDDDRHGRALLRLHARLRPLGRDAVLRHAVGAHVLDLGLEAPVLEDLRRRGRAPAHDVGDGDLLRHQHQVGADRDRGQRQQDSRIHSQRRLRRSAASRSATAGRPG